MSVIGTAITEDNWIVECPHCGNEAEYEGYFDPGDEYRCKKCKKKYYVDKLVFINGNEIK